MHKDQHIECLSVRNDRRKKEGQKERRREEGKEGRTEGKKERMDCGKKRAMGSIKKKQNKQHSCEMEG